MLASPHHQRDAVVTRFAYLNWSTYYHHEMEVIKQATKGTSNHAHDDT